MMASYLVYFNVFEASTIVNNPYNKRIDNLENKVVRGNILAADGQTLQKQILMRMEMRREFTRFPKCSAML